MAAPHFFDTVSVASEIIFTVIAVVFCILIYFRTRESYELTKYKGIMYFRDAFLFFGLSYAMRFLFGIVFLSRIAFDFMLPRAVIMPLLMLPMGYFSTVGIFYLIFGLVWKGFDNKRLLILGHGIAILLSALTFFTMSHLILFYLQFALLAVAVMFGFALRREEERKASQIKVLYLLVAALWLVNLMITGRRRLFPFGLELFFEAVSLAVFAYICHKITKWVKLGVGIFSTSLR